ncbi:MAG: RNA methyltransferase [Candidatus Latescibacteria bacterium]|nr:RNA methyltransferase [Candidatus Latescibacterota bacterium]MDP7449550.1 RNA methyltransferase [Candidatus Latescibacterota bacterium]HJP31468.1 RNA methyltransferase [Candidatus Latescibacterota bacterium]
MSRRREVSGVEESTFDVRSRDLDIPFDEYTQRPKFPVTLVLDNLRSAFNVGSIFRTADTTRLERIITCGYTAHPPHPRLDKTALGTIDYVDTAHTESTVETVADLQSQGVAVWALETTSDSLAYTEVEYPRPVALVLGNEALGVEREVLDLCDRMIEVPVFGYKNSLNVACTAAVVVYEILRQWRYEPEEARN